MKPTSKTRSATRKPRKGLTWEERVKEADKHLSPLEKRFIENAARKASRSGGVPSSVQVKLVGAAPRRKKKTRTEAELRSAYVRAFDRLSDLAEVIRDVKDTIDEGEYYRLVDAVSDAKIDLQIAREGLEEAGYKVSSRREVSLADKLKGKKSVKSSSRRRGV